MIFNCGYYVKRIKRLILGRVLWPNETKQRNTRFLTMGGAHKCMFPVNVNDNMRRVCLQIDNTFPGKRLRQL